MPRMDLACRTVDLALNQLIIILEIINLLDHFLEAYIIDLGNAHEGTGLMTGHFVRCPEDIDGLNNFTFFLYRK